MCQCGGVRQPPGEASMGQASTIGLDIAKWVFQAHGADETGRVVFRKRLVRAKVLEFFVGQPPCLVKMKLPRFGGRFRGWRTVALFASAVCSKGASDTPRRSAAGWDCSSLDEAEAGDACR